MKKVRNIIVLLCIIICGLPLIACENRTASLGKIKGQEPVPSDIIAPIDPSDNTDKTNFPDKTDNTNNPNIDNPVEGQPSNEPNKDNPDEPDKTDIPENPKDTNNPVVTTPSNDPEAETPNIPSNPGDTNNPQEPENPITPIKPDDSESPSPVNPDKTDTTPEVHKHKLEHKAAVEAKCIVEGRKEYWECKECGKKYSDEWATQEVSSVVISAKGHDIVEDKAIPATCEANGLTAGSHCKECNKIIVEQKTVNATGHEITADEPVSPSCETNGLTVGTHCKICNKVITVQEIIPALGHEYIDIIIAPTCETGGYTLHKCKNCGEEKTTDETSALGHEIAEDAAVPATCGSDGVSAGSHCSRCDKVLIETQTIPALGHEYTVTVIDPTCTTDGYTVHKCERCGDSFTDNEVQATGHSYAEEWSFDEDFHWHNVKCGCDTEPEKVTHDHEVNDICECGHKAEKYVLEFTKDGEGYTVSGIKVKEGIETGSLEIDIPSEYEGMSVTKISENAFAGNLYIRKVFIPKTIKDVGKGAFFGCKNLKYAEIENIRNWRYKTSANSSSIAFNWSNISGNAKYLIGEGAKYYLYNYSA